MNIFGVGGMELVFILIIMLVVAGPKRMIQWAYIMGQYTARFRKMWEETIDYVQKEFDEAGVDVKLPKDVPTRANLNRTINKALKPITAPVQEALDEVNSVKKAVATGVSANGLNDDTKRTLPEEPDAPPKDTFGTWSGTAASEDNTEKPS